MDDRQFHDGVKRTGVSELDDEHQALYDEADGILRLVGSMAPAPEVKSRFDAFRRDLADHFRHEETMAGEGGYSVSEDHREEHRRLNREAARLLDGFETKGPATVSKDLQAFLEDIQNHVAFRDTEHRFRTTATTGTP